MGVNDWYTVEFDTNHIWLRASPPGRQPWEQQIRWADIERICFEAEDIAVSDGIYVFTNRRSKSYAIPIEAHGGQELWNEIISRGLFDAKLAIKAATSIEGIFCWPQAD